MRGRRKDNRDLSQEIRTLRNEHDQEILTFRSEIEQLRRDRARLERQNADLLRQIRAFRAATSALAELVAAVGLAPGKE